MARSYVFFAHGVGTHAPADWWLSWKETLITALRRFAPYDALSPDEIEREHLAFVPIRYDAVFEGYRKRWQSASRALADHDVIAQAGLADAFTWVAAQDGALQRAFWSHALDAVLWYALPQARAAVQALVAQQVAAGLADMVRSGGTGAHLIAHSLGTSVLHDALVGLVAADDVHDGVLRPAQLRWQSITMVANTSRLLKAWRDIDAQASLPQYDPYRSSLCPGREGSITDMYLSVRHQIDPITWPRRFAPVDWSPSRYSDVMTMHFRNPAEVHDLTHYLENPQVHLPLLRLVVGRAGLGTSAEIRRVWDQFRSAHPLTASTAFADLKRLFGDDGERRLDVRELTEFLTRAYRVLT